MTQHIKKFMYSYLDLDETVSVILTILAKITRSLSTYMLLVILKSQKLKWLKSGVEVDVVSAYEFSI